MPLDLRPLTLAELLDRSFSTYKQHLWLFVGIMAPPAAIAMLYALVMQALQFSLGFAAPAGPPRPEEMARLIAPLMVGGLLFIAVYTTIYAFALGATTIAVARLYNRQPVSVGAAYRDVRRHGGRLILLMIWGTLRIFGAWMGLVVLCFALAFLTALIAPVLGGIVMFVGVLASFVGVAYLAVRYGVAVPAVVLENLKAGQALARSVELTDEHRGRVFLLILCAVIITYATAALLQGPFMMGAMMLGPESRMSFALMMVGAVLGTIGGMFSGPLMIIGLAMLYYDLRIRKEALDLDMMLEALDAPPA